MVVELIIIAIWLWQTIVYMPPQNDPEKFFFFVSISRSVFGIISFLITLQLRKLINSFKKEAFFELINAKRIQNIALLLFLYVILDVTLNFLNPNQHLYEGISKGIGYRFFMKHYFLLLFIKKIFKFFKRKIFNCINKTYSRFCCEPLKHISCPFRIFFYKFPNH